MAELDDGAFEAAWDSVAGDSMTILKSEMADAILAYLDATRLTMIERLKDAVEGECDGLAIDDSQALAILQYVFGEEAALSKDQQCP